MSMTDTVADMLTRIRNANMVRHDRVEIPGSKLKAEIARILHEEGYIQSYRLIEDRKQGILRIYLKYDDNGMVSPKYHELFLNRPVGTVSTFGAVHAFSPGVTPCNASRNGISGQHGSF